MKLLPLARVYSNKFRALYNLEFPRPTLVQRFPLKELLRTEQYLHEDQIRHYMRLTPNHKPASIVLYRGKKLIWDGNHRCHARLNKGFKTIRALVYDMENQ
jgi:hypothetical protein